MRTNASHMRQFILATALALVGVSAQAQNSDAPETLFGGFKVDNIGVMAEGFYGFSQISGSDAHILGARAGAVFNNQFTLGGYFQQSVNQTFRPTELLPADQYMDLWSAGGFVEYTLAANKLVHLTLPVMIGVGEVQADNDAGDLNNAEATFLLIEPAVLLEVNLMKNLRFNLGTAYRFTSDFDYLGVDQNDLAGLRFHGGIKFVLNRAS